MIPFMAHQAAFWLQHRARPETWLPAIPSPTDPASYSIAVWPRDLSDFKPFLTYAGRDIPFSEVPA